MKRTYTRRRRRSRRRTRRPKKHQKRPPVGAEKCPRTADPKKRLFFPQGGTPKTVTQKEKKSKQQANTENSTKQKQHVYVCMCMYIKRSSGRRRGSHVESTSCTQKYYLEFWKNRCFMLPLVPPFHRAKHHRQT